MTIADLMLRTHPKDLGDLDQAALLACIQACIGVNYWRCFAIVLV